MNLDELLEGKVITTARIEDGLLYLQLGANESVIVMQVLTWGAADTVESTIQ